MEIEKRIGNGRRIHDDVRAFLRNGQGSRTRRINQAINNYVSDMHTMFGVLFGEHLRVMPQVEVVRPLGTTSFRSQPERESYYLLVSGRI